MNDFLTFVRERYSVRKYDAKPVEQEKLDLILQAAFAAPTARNFQPQKIYVVTSEAGRKALAEVTPCTFQAPVIFVIGYDETRCSQGRVCEGFNFGTVDASIVCTHMMLEAADLGLGSCWVGMFNEDEVKTALDLPQQVRVRALLPVGYPAEDAAPSAMHTACREMEDMVAYL